MNGDARGSNADVRVSRDDLHQLHAARRDGRQEKLRWCQFFAGATILDRTIDDEVVGARITEHSAKNIGRTRSNVILANRSWSGGSSHVSGARGIGAWGCTILVELTARGGLLGLNAAGRDIRAEIILAAHRISI